MPNLKGANFYPSWEVYLHLNTDRLKTKLSPEALFWDRKRARLAGKEGLLKSTITHTKA